MIYVILLVINEHYKFLDSLIRNGILAALLGSNILELIKQIKKGRSK